MALPSRRARSSSTCCRPALRGESLAVQHEQRKGLGQQHPSAIPSNKNSCNNCCRGTSARASGSLPVQAPAGCRGSLGLPLIIAIYQQQHMVQQQQFCLITPVKSESSHLLSGEVLRDGEGRSKGGEGKRRKEGKEEEEERGGKGTGRRGGGVKGRRRISQEKEKETEKEHARQGFGKDQHERKSRR